MPSETGGSVPRAGGDPSAEDLARWWDLSRDLFIVADLDGRFVALNANWTRLLGWSLEELVEQSYLEFVHPDDLDRTAAQAEEMAHDARAVTFDNRYRSRDGRYRWLRWSATADRDAGRMYAVAQDITAARRTGALLELHRRVAVAANEATDLESALREAMAAVCEVTDWSLGHAYLPEPESGIWVPSGIWWPEAPDRFAGFRQLTGEARFRTGEGLPGLVASTATPAWIPDVAADPDFVRAGPDEAGIRAALAFPVLAGHHVGAVLEFFSEEPAEADEPLLRVMASLGRDLGRVIDRTEAEAERARLLEELADANDRLEDANQRLERLAHFDDLTGLANRNLLEPSLAQALARARRAGTLVGVFFIDLDGFKQVNDRLGHATGDRVLAEFATALAGAVRAGDTAARWGGDEFVMVADLDRHPDDTDVIAARILEVARRCDQIAGQPIHVRASIGVAVCDGDTPPAEALRIADQLLYQAKVAGGDRHLFRRM